MGWWSDIKDAVKSAVKKVVPYGDVIVSAAEKFSDWIFGSSEEAAEKVSKSESYDRDRATAEQTMRINSILVDFKNQAIDKSDSYEGDLERIFEDHMDDLIEIIEEINGKKVGDVAISVPTRRMRVDIKSSLRKIRGRLRQDIIPKLSLDNQECLEILKKDRGADKKREMLDFINGFLKELMRELKTSLTKDINENIKYIKECLDTSMESLERNLEQRISYLEQIGESFDDVEKKEEMQIKLAYELWKSQYISAKSK